MRLGGKAREKGRKGERGSPRAAEVPFFALFDSSIASRLAGRLGQTMLKVAPPGEEALKGGIARTLENASPPVPTGRAVFDGFAISPPRHERVFGSQNLEGGTHGQCSREHRDVHPGWKSSEGNIQAEAGIGAMLFTYMRASPYKRFLHSLPAPPFGLRRDKSLGRNDDVGGGKPERRFFRGLNPPVLRGGGGSRGHRPPSPGGGAEDR